MVAGPNGEVRPGSGYCHACERWIVGGEEVGRHVQRHHGRLLVEGGLPVNDVEARKVLWRAMNAMLGSDEPPPADGVLRVPVSDEEHAQLEAERDRDREDDEEP